MDWLSKIFGYDDYRHRRQSEEEAERKLSPAMPPAGASAELSGDRRQSETEKALKRAAGKKRNAS